MEYYPGPIIIHLCVNGITGCSLIGLGEKNSEFESCEQNLILVKVANVQDLWRQCQLMKLMKTTLISVEYVNVTVHDFQGKRSLAFPPNQHTDGSNRQQSPQCRRMGAADKTVTTTI